MPRSDRAMEGSLNRTPARLSNIPSLPLWVRAVVVLGAVLMATGAVLAFVRPQMLVSPHDEINGAVRIYADYLTSRNLTIASMLLAALAIRARNMLHMPDLADRVRSNARCRRRHCRRSVGDRAGSRGPGYFVLSCRGPALGVSILER